MKCVGVRKVQILFVTTCFCLNLVSTISVLQPQTDKSDDHQNLLRSFYTDESNVRNIEKRTKSGDSSQGKCTCTCETKLVKDADTKGGNSVVDELPTVHHQAGKIQGKGGSTVQDELAADEPESTNDALDMKSAEIDDLHSSDLDRYASNYGHGSRYPWKRLPDTMCLREPCKSDKDCCLWYSICDRSASICRDCWYGDHCSSESDCCKKYPLCLRSKDDGGVTGKCVDKE